MRQDLNLCHKSTVLSITRISRACYYHTRGVVLVVSWRMHSSFIFYSFPDSLAAAAAHLMQMHREAKLTSVFHLRPFAQISI